MNQNEYYYRRTVSAIGFSLLIWVGFFEIFGVIVSYIFPLLSKAFFQNAPVVSTVVNQVAYAAGYLTGFMLPVLFLRRFIKRTGYSYQPMYSLPSVSPWLPLIILSGVTIVFSAAYLNSALMNLIGYDPSVFATDLLTDSSDPKLYELILDFIVVCLVPGFCEEFLFRGAILSNCLPFGKGKAILISALLFSLMHRNPAQILYTFVAGILLGIIYVKTKSIWNCVILHTVNNFVSNTEVVIQSHLKDRFFAMTWIQVLEILLFTLGIISTVILILRFFSKKDTEVREGIFAKNLPEGDDYALCPISPERAKRLFMAPSMVVFMALCVLQILLLLVIVIVGGSLLELLG